MLKMTAIVMMMILTRLTAESSRGSAPLEINGAQARLTFYRRFARTVNAALGSVPVDFPHIWKILRPDDPSSSRFLTRTAFALR
jgi:hypothetical protein